MHNSEPDMADAPKPEREDGRTNEEGTPRKFNFGLDDPKPANNPEEP